MGFGKLIKEERTVAAYKKTKSKYLGNPVKEVNVDLISLDTLRQIVTPNSEDFFLCNAYELFDEEISKLNKYISNKIIPDFSMFEYFLECYGIYEKE